MAIIGGGKRRQSDPIDLQSSKENPPLDYIGRHRKTITPVNDNPVITTEQAAQLAADIALFDQ